MDKNSFDPNGQNEAVKKLSEDLIEMNTLTTARVEDEMLSIIVDEASQGVDISKRYPTLYRKLIKNVRLRQAFIDILGSLEKEEQNEFVALPKSPTINLDFLKEHSSEPILEILDQDTWRISWLRTFDQLREIFSPREFVFRLDADLLEDPWFTLLRKEFEAGNSQYTVVLDCTLSEKGDEAISPYLNIAVTFGAASQPEFPIHARLQWGEYDERIPITEEGRIKLPDIPLSATFDEEFNLVDSELNFTLEAAP